MDLLRSRSNLLPAIDIIEDLGPPPDSLPDLDPAEAPSDRFNFVYLTCAMVGTASLLPYQMFIASADYVGNEIEPNGGNNFYADILQYANVANFLSITFMIFIGRKTPFWSRLVGIQLIVAISIFSVPFVYRVLYPPNAINRNINDLKIYTFLQVLLLHMVHY